MKICLWASLAGEPKTKYFSFDVSDAQANQASFALAKFTGVIENTSNYNIFNGTVCTGYVKAVLIAAGINVEGLSIYPAALQQQFSDVAQNGYFYDNNSLVPVKHYIDGLQQTNYSTTFTPIYPCFLADTPILVPNGTTALIQDVKPGDRVATFDGDARQGRDGLLTGNVSRIFGNIAREVIAIHYVAGGERRVMHLTPRHVMLTETGEFKEARTALMNREAFVGHDSPRR